ncbi:MAG: bifunctional riboflavin kinase/FAD synthetase [Gammaproteobacteria bacterium]|jgi:riboflavin kinase/FMN adenylyltransferase|nr:bifunctional riboflavin kinase/FAD synthetase [Gammaproteobacteria bacterium]
MEVVVGQHNIRPRHRGCVLTVGSFDGVHRGHKMLLEHLVAKGRELGAPSMLMTFEPTPREYFRGGVVPARLTRFREKITLLERTELDRVLCLPFNERTASLDADWVVEELLVKRLGIRYLVVGDDFRFGQGARGDFAMLEAAGERHGFGVSRMGTLTAGSERISSTRVRAALADGDFALAEDLLGHPYFMMGRVVYGRQLGRELGVPTANIRLQRYRTPLEGVFAVTVTDGLDKTYEGVANVGVRPTVDGKEPLLEVHLFDFAEDIYGSLLTVEFKQKIRDERTFDGLDALKAQIARDIAHTREFFADA